MKCTNEQLGVLMNKTRKHSQVLAVVKAGGM